MSSTAVEVTLISPHAHFPSHYWQNTLALMQALAGRGLSVQVIVFTTDTPIIGLEHRDKVAPVFRQMPVWWHRFVSGNTQHRRFTKILSSFETVACLLKSFRLARRQSKPVLHWIGGAQWPLFLAVLCCRRPRFVYSLFGRLTQEQTASAPTSFGRRIFDRLVLAAVGTGRLDFVCETDLIADNAARLAGAHVHLIPYAIRTAKPLPEKSCARAQLGFEPGETIFLFFGTHRLEKDYRTALRGCLMLPNRPLAVFVGKVISANDPHAVVAECGYPKARIVDEFVSDELAELYFAAADVVVLPYEKNFTRGSGVLIESCRYQRPMLVSAAPYLSRFVSRYRCGETFEPGNAQSFAEAAQRLLAEPGAYLPGLAQARHDHSWEVLIERYIAVYSGSASNLTG